MRFNKNEVYREKMEMNDRINVLNDGLQYYKTIEKTLQKALILAERTFPSIVVAVIAQTPLHKMQECRLRKQGYFPQNIYGKGQRLRQW